MQDAPTTDPAMNGKHTWEEALLEQNRSWLMAFLRSSVGNRDDAQDIAQDVFAIAIKNSGKYDGSVPVGAWLRGIARNCIREYWRKKGRLPAVLNEEALDQLNTMAENSEEKWRDEELLKLRIQTLRECMKSLSEKIRTLLEKKYNQNLRSDAIAKQMNMAVGAVNVGVSRGRESLYECLRKKMAVSGYDC